MASIVKKRISKTVVIYIPIPNYSPFGKFQNVGPNMAKRKIKILRNRR